MNICESEEERERERGGALAISLQLLNLTSQRVRDEMVLLLEKRRETRNFLSGFLLIKRSGSWWHITNPELAVTLLDRHLVEFYSLVRTLVLPPLVSSATQTNVACFLFQRRSHETQVCLSREVLTKGRGKEGFRLIFLINLVRANLFRP